MNFGGFGGDSHFRNPFDDPFFKTSNFPDFPSFADNTDRFKPTRPDPPKPNRPDAPSPVPPKPDPAYGGGSGGGGGGGYRSAGRKLINDINVPLSGILSRFSELIEKNNSDESVKRNINKDPKKFKDSFTKIVKESHVDNFIPSQVNPIFELFMSK